MSPPARLLPTVTLLALLACAPDRPAPPAEAPAPAAGGEFSRAPWDASRAAGYTFRAVGQEPGWTVEIAPDAPLRALLDYGERELLLPVRSVTRDGPRTTYHAASDDAELWVSVDATPCADAMSGEPMSHSVSVRVDSRELHGCGRQLQP